MALNEGALQHKGFKLGSGQNHVEIPNLRNHGGCFERMPRGILKILADPVFKRLRLSDIDDPAGCVQHEVDTRFYRQ
jgi:hypothetical protein